MPQVMWKGAEAVRSLRKGDLGLDPDDDTELVWSAETRFTQEMTQEEYDALRKVAGGSWALVEDEPEDSTSASMSESSSESDQPQESSSEPAKGGKTSKA